MLHNYGNRLIYAANKLSANCTRKRQGVEQLAIDVLLNCAKVSNVSEKSVIICLFYTPFICIVIRLTRKCQRVKFWRAWLWCSNCKLLKRICTLWCGTLSGEARKSEHLPLTGAFAWVTANWLDVCGSCAYSHMHAVSRTFTLIILLFSSPLTLYHRLPLVNGHTRCCCRCGMIMKNHLCFAAIKIPLLQ